MSFEKTGMNQGSSEIFNPENKIEKFEKIKTPEELLLFMENNITYGYIGKNNKKVYTFDNPENEKKAHADFESEYYMQSPEELLKSNHGVCWDQTELERYWFSKQGEGCNFKTLIMVNEENPKEGINPHTFLIFEKDEKWHWFEHSFSDFRGIHLYDKLEDLIIDVVKNVWKFCNQDAEKEVMIKDLENAKVFEYETPNFGSGPEEFVFPIIEKKYPNLMTKTE